MLETVHGERVLMLHELKEEHQADRQALAEREADLEAGRDALAAGRAALDSEIGAIEAAVRCQESRVQLNVGGAHFETSRTTLTAAPGSMLEAMFSGRHTIVTGEDGRVWWVRRRTLWTHP